MDDANVKIMCPDCNAEIVPIEGMVVGDILECGECGTEVEIQSLSPITYRELVEEK
ncbi:MAG: lysine biosynthesis protein LysW [Microgenomates group bacterium]